MKNKKTTGVKKAPPKKKPGKKRGRPSKYQPKYCKMLVQFFSAEPNREIEVLITTKKGNTVEKTELRANELPFFSGFARKVGVSHDTLLEWCKTHPSFSEAYKKAKGLQEEFLATNALMGLYQSTFSIFTAKNILGWRDQKQLEHTTPPDQPFQVAVMQMTPEERQKTLVEMAKKHSKYFGKYGVK